LAREGQGLQATNDMAVEWAGLESVPQRLDRLTLCGRPEDVALVDRQGALTFAQLDQGVGTLAAALAVRTQPGDRIASWLPKTRTACLLALACARAGLVHVPVNPMLKRAQVAHILLDSGARLLITQAVRTKLLEKEDVPSDCSMLIEEEIAAETREALPPSTGDTDALAALLYTSGSTGRPKGVMLSHANLWLGAIAVAHYLGVAPGDRTLAVLPLSFDAGLNQLLSSWAAGAAAAPIDYLVANDVVRAVERHGITTLAGVPPLWIQLAEAGWPAETAARLRILSATGGRMPVPLVRRLRGLFPQASLTLMYGLTEAFRSTRLDPALVDRHPESIGRAVPFAEVMVARPDGSLADVGEPGELVHAGPLVGKGYWRDPERTARRFRPAPKASRLGGVAVWSGDNVVRDADGLLRFVGRDDEMIKVSGNRVSPTEIEEAAIASGAAREAVAIGVADDRLGQAIRLIVRGDGDEARLLGYFKAELPGFQQPREVIWVDKFPRNPNGKLDRVAIAGEYGA
jgi:acyl-CoA ligase (AMP-forming) (exosortase A-associated)